MRKTQYLSFDAETTGLSVHAGAQIFGYATCDGRGRCEVVRDGWLDRLRDLIARAEQREIALVMHNSAFDLQFAEHALGRTFAEQIEFHDTMIAHHMLRNDHHSHALKDLLWEYCGYSTADEDEVKKHCRRPDGAIDYSIVPVEIMNRYQHHDARRTMLLWKFLAPKMLAKGSALWDCYELERDAIVPTIRMEDRGFMIDRARTTALLEEMRADAIVAQDEFCALYGRRVNVGADAVLRYIFYTERRMPVIGKTKKAGVPSVEKEILDELFTRTGDPLLQLAIRYKARRRGATTLASYLKVADARDVIHPSIHTLGAKKTGRESASNPNLQNVEKEGRARNPFPTPARKCFRPRPGHVNFHVDYAGIELRLLVHYSADAELVDEVRRPDGDPHLLAARIFYAPFTDAERRDHPEFCARYPNMAAGIDAFPSKSKEWSTLRDPAKNTNFAVPYGAGADKAAVTLGLPREIALRRFDEYRARFPRLCSMTRDVVATVKRFGGVETTFGRFLRVPRDQAYAGVNYLIQGTAAQILKRAQARVHRYLQAETDGAVGLLLPIHDELIVEWPRVLLKRAKPMWREIRAMMIDFPIFSVPLEVEVDVATRDWSDKKRFEFVNDN